jgi:hypothetical protein
VFGQVFADVNRLAFSFAADLALFDVEVVALCGFVALQEFNFCLARVECDDDDGGASVGVGLGSFS